MLPRIVDAKETAAYRHSGCGSADPSPSRCTVEAINPIVSIFPASAAKRRTVRWPGMTVETVQTNRRDRTELRFRGPVHLLIVHERGMRRAGETRVAGSAASALRNPARKLTFVPAGQEYCEWREPRTTSSLMFVYFDTANPRLKSAWKLDDASPTARLFFEDATLWRTALKLKHLVQNSMTEDLHYLEAVGAMLVHELARLYRGASGTAALPHVGLAGWQKRVVTEYIEEHLGEPISLATLAELARLSPFHFCRTFKRSFGVPPRRYHTRQRIERAKALLADASLSVTDIAMAVGFSESSAFSAAFRKATGLTPTAYHVGLMRS